MNSGLLARWYQSEGENKIRVVIGEATVCPVVALVLTTWYLHSDAGDGKLTPPRDLAPYSLHSTPSS